MNNIHGYRKLYKEEIGISIDVILMSGRTTQKTDHILYAVYNNEHITIKLNKGISISDGVLSYNQYKELRSWIEHNRNIINKHWDHCLSRNNILKLLKK